MKFFSSLLGAFATLSIAWLAGLFLQLGKPTLQSRWVAEAYDKKIEIAARTPSPRMLLVAGSSALFGIRSITMSTALDTPVVNLAVNAGLGLRYILWKARQVAHAGDVILLPLEYALYADPDEPNSQIVDFAIARDTAFFWDLPLMLRVSYIAAMSPARWLEGLLPYEDRPIVNGDYGAFRIDEHGDQTQTSERDQAKSHREELKKSRTWEYGKRLASGDGGFPQLAAFARWARSASVCVIAIPAAFLERPEYRTNPVEANFYSRLAERVRASGIPYLGDPYDFMYPNSWFFNTDYHLLDWAREKHTQRLIEFIAPRRPTLCPEPGSSPAPALPHRGP